MEPGIAARLTGRPIACVNAHSLAVLPLAARLKRQHGAMLIYEPHELETETSETRGLRRPLSKLAERRLIGEADAVICVSDTIAQWYRREYGLSNVHVFRNIPDVSLSAAPVAGGRLRDRCGVSDDAILFIYQGSLTKYRQVEQYLHVFSRVPPNRRGDGGGRGEGTTEHSRHSRRAGEGGVRLHARRRCGAMRG